MRPLGLGVWIKYLKKNIQKKQKDELFFFYIHIDNK